MRLFDVVEMAREQHRPVGTLEVKLTFETEPGEGFDVHDVEVADGVLYLKAGVTDGGS